jgi:hypothetical protein
MAEIKVSTQDSNVQRQKPRNKPRWFRRWWIISSISLIVLAITAGSIKIITSQPAPTEAPETARVLKAQESMDHFGIVIPGYLPKGFDRANVEIKVDQNGPGGEPEALLAYRGKKDAAIFIEQWVPINPQLETLSGSRIIETKWGKSWLLTQGTDALVTLWVDVGPLRVSLSSTQDVVSREQMVEAANTLGIASYLQVFSNVTDLPQIKDMAPPPPFVVPLNAEGIQELNLTITPGGYSPIRFSVKKGIPVRVNFRQMGEVGCGNVLMMPTGDGKNVGLTLSKTVTLQTTTFTPPAAGTFQFQCASNHYRGIMTVEEER